MCGYWCCYNNIIVWRKCSFARRVQLHPLTSHSPYSFLLLFSENKRKKFSMFSSVNRDGHYWIVSQFIQHKPLKHSVLRQQKTKYPTVLYYSYIEFYNKYFIEFFNNSDSKESISLTKKICLSEFLQGIGISNL